MEKQNEFHRSEKPKQKRWECCIVKTVPITVDSNEWQYLLETLAEELYNLNHQLRETDSHSLHHPSETKTLVTKVAKENGAGNGKDTIKLAA